MAFDIDSVSYIYQRMPMGLSTRPAILQYYINAILSSIPDRSTYLAVMNYLLLHIQTMFFLTLEDLLKTLFKNELKLS